MIKVTHVNDAEFHYLEEGDPDRSTVLFVHGSLNDYRSWQSQLEAFSASYHVIAYSRRNHYPNAWRDYPADYSVRTERDDLVGLVQSLGLKAPVHIVASSYGALIAAFVARDRPEIVRSLVLGEPPMLFLIPEAEHRVFEAGFSQKVLKPLTAGDEDAAAAGFIDSIQGEGAFLSLPLNVRRSMLQNSSSLRAELTTPGRDRFTREDAGKMRAPTLLVQGELTSEMYRDIVATLAHSIPRVQAAVIPRASHTPQNTEPEAYNKMVLDFLKALG